MGRKRTHNVKLIYPEWEQQPNEDSVAYLKFKTYRGLGVNRTIDGAARSLSPPENLHQEINSCRKLSQRFFWSERASKYEEYLSKKEIDKDIKARKDMMKRHADHAASAELAVMSFIQKYLEHVQRRQLDLVGLTNKEIYQILPNMVRALTTTAELERKVRGEPTEIIQNNNLNTNVNLNANYDNLTDDEFLQKIKELGFERKSEI
jgi:hypothetical protein